MRIILSPAKKMVQNEEFFLPSSKPQFLNQTECLMQTMQNMSYDQLKQIWKCSDRLTADNMERLRYMDLYHHLTPALLSYEGIAYQHMAPRVFSEREMNYINEHLRIVSGFYGILRPTDGVTSYRLEMGAKLQVGAYQDLYHFWHNQLADCLGQETNLIVNLASKEYSKAVAPYLPSHVRMITCVFAQRKGTKLIEQSTACKMARGDMVRFLAEQEIEDPVHMQFYDRMHYHFVSEESEDSTYVFVKEN